MAITKISAAMTDLDGAVTINESSADVDFRVESDANANRLFVDAGEDKVLFGTTASRNMSGVTSSLFQEGTSYDLASLGLVANTNASNGAYLMLGTSRGTSNGSSTIVQDNDELGGIFWHGADGTDIASAAAFVAAYVDGTPGSNDMPGRLVFATTADGASTATERMRIDSAGNVGIATSSPLNVFDTQFSASAHTSGISITNQQNGGWGSALAFNSSRSDDSSIKTAARVRTEGAEAWGADSTTSSNLIFETRSDNTLAERMRLLAGGGLGVGTTTVTYTLQVDGTSIMGAQYNAGAVMPLTDNTYDLGHSSYRWDDIYATNNTIQTSDKNLKDNITESDLGLSFIKELKPVSYKWKDKTRTHYGLIAQDVETVLSDISKPTSDFAGFIKMEPEEEAPKHEENPVTETRYGLRYNEFIAPLIKAIQEQQTLIETLQTKVKALEEA